MNPTFIGIGLCLMAAGSGLSALGHYDGVLGAEDPSTFLAASQTREATTRVTVTGTPDEARSQFLAYETSLLIPRALESPMRDGPWVPVRIVDMEAESYLRATKNVPAPGTRLVVTGDVAAYWPLHETGSRIVTGDPILLISPSDYHEPIFFKA